MLTLLCLAALLVLAACKQPMEHPEQADSIYQDLNSEHEAAEKALSEEKKTKADLEKTLRELPPRDPTRGQTLRSIRTQGDKVTALEQQAMYYEVRAGQRKEWDAKEYARRFEKDLPWPDKQEAAEYQEMKRLRTASRNWNDRVPKSTRYMKNPPPTEGKPKAKEGGGHEE